MASVAGYPTAPAKIFRATVGWAGPADLQPDADGRRRAALAIYRVLRAYSSGTPSVRLWQFTATPAGGTAFSGAGFRIVFPPPVDRVCLVAARLAAQVARRWALAPGIPVRSRRH